MVASGLAPFALNLPSPPLLVRPALRNKGGFSDYARRHPKAALDALEQLARKAAKYSGHECKGALHADSTGSTQLPLPVPPIIDGRCLVHDCPNIVSP